MYTYGDASWGDLLTGYDGNTITYDGIGNPLSDGTWTYTWQNGRELASMTSGNTTWSYTYDANGMRKTRSNGTTTYNYLYNGSQLVQLTRGTDVLYFDHATGTVTWNGTTYYYVYNLQGDVIAILDSAGTAVVNYAYDAWGNLLATTGSMASTLGTLNPLTYRAYTYDHETGLYYLQSRYYNPEVGRFLNADAYASTGQGILGNNMFAYCGNNPANRADPTGHAFMQMSFDPDGAHGMLTLGPWGGGSGGVAYAGRAFSSAVSSIRNEFNKLSYISQENKNSAQIVDSYKVTNPITMYMYIDEYRGDEISGSTTGVVAEWIVHDIAYGAGWVLNECGLTDIGQAFMHKAADLDINGTIYQDDHGVLSYAMWGLYLICAPIHSRVDLLIEVFG